MTNINELLQNLPEREIVVATMGDDGTEYTLTVRSLFA